MDNGFERGRISGWEALNRHKRHSACAPSCVQGVDEGPDGLKLISEVIGECLGIPMSVLMGANIANEVADEKFCETTIGENPITTHMPNAAHFIPSPLSPQTPLAIISP